MKTNIYVTILGLMVLFSACESKDVLAEIEGLPASVINDDPMGAPQRIIEQTWNNGNDTLYRQYFDDYTAVYFDGSVERPMEWPYQFTSDLWKYVVELYGNMGPDPLYSVFHINGTPFMTTYFDESGGNRNIIDIPLEGTEQSAGNMDNLILGASEIVESASNGVFGSPARDIWGDQWSRAFLYDVYANLDMGPDSTRVYNENMAMTVDYPSPGTNWFKNWFLPLYENYGGNTSLSRFLAIAAARYPKLDGSYQSQMNMGEFVHFYSGAIGTDLQPMAETAFGWKDDWDTELVQAKMDYPDMPYDFDPVTEIADITAEANAIVSVNYENPGGPYAAEGSSKVIDGDIATKYLTFNYAPDLFIQQIFGAEAQVVNRYTLTSANDAVSRDPKSWQLLGSDDGINWTVLDTRTDHSFTDRGQTVEFVFENETPYHIYRLAINENHGDGLFQLAEWRLLVLRLIE